MRAAAVGLLELMSTGGLISMEWRCWDAWEDLLAMVREVKECRFLVFFLVSECFEAELLCAVADGHSAVSTPGTGGLSHSISCLAAELNWKGKPAEHHKVRPFSAFQREFFPPSVLIYNSKPPR